MGCRWYLATFKHSTWYLSNVLFCGKLATIAGTSKTNMGKDHEEKNWGLLPTYEWVTFTFFFHSVFKFFQNHPAMPLPNSPHRNWEIVKIYVFFLSVYTSRWFLHSNTWTGCLRKLFFFFLPRTPFFPLEHSLEQTQCPSTTAQVS